jgi:hypothetical protein
LIAELRQVKDDADLEKTKTGKVLKYKEYLSQLLSAAVAFDSQFSIKKVKHNVVSQNIIDSNYESTKDDDVYDMDAPAIVIL